MPEETVLRIAHGYGNRRGRIARALEAGVDLIEADLRGHGGEVWVRHEHRLAALPILYNYRLQHVHRLGPYALSAGPFFFRLDRRPLRLGELLQVVAGRAGLLFDLKAGGYSAAGARRFVARVLRQLRESSFPGRVAFTGSWPLLDIVRAARPETPLYYSIDGPGDWQRARPRLESGTLPGASLRSSLADEAHAAALREGGARFVCWDVTDEAAARRAIALGAEGILASDLALLERLRGTPVAQRGAA